MALLCSETYFLGFVVLGIRLNRICRERERGTSSVIGGVLLVGLTVIAAAAYTLRYPEAARSTHALTLVGGAMIGQGVGLWESRQRKAESRNVGGETVLALIVLLAVGAVWQVEPGHLFQYRRLGRWSGPWDTPNTFGMLMGVGAVLAVGMLVSRKAESRKLKAEMGGEHPTYNVQHRTSNSWRWIRRGLLVGAAGAMGIGLVKSYSRGAWVGTALGLAYLMLNAEGRIKNDEEGIGKAGRRRAAGLWCALAVICASVGVLGFWSFGDTERAVARRVYSVANAKDFSWRNRVAAWEGALQMIAERPWSGFGWNQPERVYSALYRPAKVDEGMAIQLNDYFTLGMTLGIPALVCFVTYVGLSLAAKSRSPGGTLNLEPGTSQGGEIGDSDFGVRTSDLLPVVSRAGAIVLLVGFWFDGGLFKLPTAATFWVLLELGRAGGHEIHSAA